MDKLQLIKHLAELNPQLKIKDADSAVKVILDALCGSLAKGGRVEIRGFGSFSLSTCQPQQKRNPKNGGKISMPGGKIKAPLKYIPQFKPAKEMRERVSDSAKAIPVGISTQLPAASGQFNPVVIRNMENTASHV